MALTYSHTAGRAYAEKDGVVFFDTDSYPVQFFPTAEAITLTGYTITFPDLMKGNAYAFARGLEGSALKCACSSFVTIGPQEWGPSDMSPDPTSGHTLSTEVVGTVPGDTDILMCRAKMSRTTSPSQMNGTTIPVFFKEDEWVPFSGQDLLVERYGQIFARMFTLRLATTLNMDGTKNVIAERRQSVKRTLYTYWNDDNDETESGWTYGGDAGAYGHIVNVIESRGPSTDPSGVGTLYRRDSGTRCSLTDNTDYESVFTGDIEIIPGRTGINALDITARKSFTLIHEVDNNPGGATHTYTSVPIGPAHATRRVWVTVRARNDGTSSYDTVSSMSIAGTAATLAGRRGSTWHILEIWYADIPTGESGTVSITFSRSVTRSAIQVFAGYNMDNVIVDDAIGGTTDWTGGGLPGADALIATDLEGYAMAIAIAQTAPPGTGLNFTGIDNIQSASFYSTGLTKYRGYQETDGTSLNVRFNVTGGGFAAIYAMSIS